MHLHIGHRLRFGIPAPTPLLLQLQVHPNRHVFLHSETFTILPQTPSEVFTDTFGNATRRLLAQPGTIEISSDGIVEVSDAPDNVDHRAVQIPVHLLPIDLLCYLVASRYCDIDRLGEFSWQRFGNGPGGYNRVAAVCDFVHNHLTFGYGFARSTKTAHDAFVERNGVCRDFAHLAIAICRCLGIPARYATGYLGDIGVPADPAPMDFSAWFEVYLSHAWFTFDARHHRPRIGRVVMAYGRDAADTALTTSFGPTVLQHFEVWTAQAAMA
jgi:transglutaminase-like putative cysteine protease